MPRTSPEEYLFGIGELRRLFLRERQSLDVIAAHYQCHPATILRALERMGIRRTPLFAGRGHELRDLRAWGLRPVEIAELYGCKPETVRRALRALRGK